MCTDEAERTMMTFRRDALRAFTQGGEGDPPPVFVGRVKVLEDIVKTAGYAWMGNDAQRHGHGKDTRIIQGAPGAGKTSILAELKRREDPRTVRVLSLSSADVSGPGDVLIPLARLVNPESAPLFLARYQQTRAVKGGVQTFGMRAGGHVESTLSHTNPQPTLMEFHDWVMALDPGTGMTGPIIIAIDEAQRFTAAVDTPLAKLLQGLHDQNQHIGPGLPLTLVLAGLGDTAANAETMGLTRTEHVHEISALSASEVSSLMTGFCHHFGMDPRDHTVPLAQLAESCEGWPRHLHLALLALAAAALESDGILDHVNWAGVMDTAQQSQNRYYRRRQSQDMKGSASLVAAVMSALNAESTIVSVLTSIDENLRDARGWRLPEGKTAQTLVDHLIHRGALQERTDGTFTCPIPSFRTYLIEAGSRSPL